MERIATLHTKNLTIGYRKGSEEKAILKNLDLEIYPGQLVALIGANGTGKSTLIKTLARLQPPLDGEIWLEGVKTSEMSVSELASRLAIVLTDRIQPGYFTVSDLVAMGRHPYTDWRGNMHKSDLDATLDALNITGLTELKQTDLHELSDGQLQKAMIARALAQDGSLMLLDEPLIHLDIPSKWEIMKLLKRMTVERGKTVILATHELELSIQMADNIWLIDQKGRMVTGAPKTLLRNGTISETFDTVHYKFETERFIKPGS
jgi:iron complex transport system ATP-binding protein